MKASRALSLQTKQNDRIERKLDLLLKNAGLTFEESEEELAPEPTAVSADSGEDELAPEPTAKKRKA